MLDYYFRNEIKNKTFRSQNKKTKIERQNLGKNYNYPRVMGWHEIK